MAYTDAKPIPKKNEAYRVTFPILDADGDLVTGAAGLDSEISQDGNTFGDCTNEATEIATSSGVYYLDLTSTEMNADTVALIIKTSTTGAKTTCIVIYPAEAGDIPVDVQYWKGSAVPTPTNNGVPHTDPNYVKGASIATAGTGYFPADVRLGAGSTTPINNWVDAYDGTGYAFTNCTLPTVTNVTNNVTAVLADTTHGGASTTITANITGSLSGSVGSVTGSVGSVTGSVGSVTGSVGSISGITFPTNFGDLAITVTTGYVTVGDKTGYSLASDQSGVTIGTVTTLTGHTPQTGDTYALANGANGFVNLKSDTVAILDDTGTSGVLLSSSATSTQLVDDIWDEDVDTTHQTAGSAGKKLDDAGAAGDPWSIALPGSYATGTAGYIVGNMLDTNVSSRSDFDPTSTPVEILASGGTAGINATELIDLIWDEDVESNHQTAGSAGKKLDDAGSAGDPWGTSLPGAYATGTAGYIIGNMLDTNVGSRSDFDATIDTVIADVQQWNSQSIATPDTPGYPKVTIKDGTGQGEISLTSGAVDSVTTVGSVSGSVDSVTGSVGSISGITFPTNFADLAITATTGYVTVGTNNDKTGYSLSASGLNAITAWTVNITGSLSGSVGSVTGNVDGSVASVTGNVGGSVASVTGSVGSISGITFPTNFSDLAITATTGYITVGTNNDKTGYSLSASGLNAITSWTVNITGSLSGSVGSVTGNVGGDVTGSVGSISGITFPTNFSDLAITATTGRTSANLVAVNNNTNVPTDMIEIFDTGISQISSPAATGSWTLGTLISASVMHMFHKTVQDGVDEIVYLADNVTPAFTSAVSESGGIITRSKAV